MILDSMELYQGTGAVLAVVIILRICGLVIYRLYFHPLASYPGPLLAKVTSFYMVSAAIRCRDTYTRHALHEKYGHVIRTGPNELSFADITSIKDIYGQSAEPCLKAPHFYNGFTLTGLHSLFSIQDRQSHARMRRLLSHGFSERGVLAYENEIRTRIEKCLNVIAASSGGRTELHDLAHALFMDTTSELSFGKSFDILTKGNNPAAEDIETYFNIAPLFGHFPIARYLPFGPFRAAREAGPRIVKIAQSNINDLKYRLQSGLSQSGLLRQMVDAKDAGTNTAFSDAELIENMVLFIIAGSGTTASTLLYLMYEVGKSPNVQNKLEKEIREAFSDIERFPDYETATTLPYLNQIIQETLRLRGPIPTVAPRVSPGKLISGKYIPAGTIISNLAYTTQRDKNIFQDPHSFIPERWEGPTQEMKIMNRPFSTGSRNCIGQHLARVQLLLAVSALYLRFDVRLDPGVTEEMMIQRDQGVMTVGGRKLWVYATPRVQAKA